MTKDFTASLLRKERRNLGKLLPHNVISVANATLKILIFLEFPDRIRNDVTVRQDYRAPKFELQAISIGGSAGYLAKKAPFIRKLLASSVARLDCQSPPTCPDASNCHFYEVLREKLEPHQTDCHRLGRHIVDFDRYDF